MIQNKISKNCFPNVQLRLQYNSDINQDNILNQNAYYENTILVAEKCLSDENVFENKQRSVSFCDTNEKNSQIKKVRNISWGSFKNFAQILEEKNEESDENNEFSQFYDKPICIKDSFLLNEAEIVNRKKMSFETYQKYQKQSSVQSPQNSGNNSSFCMSADKNSISTARNSLFNQSSNNEIDNDRKLSDFLGDNKYEGNPSYTELQDFKIVPNLIGQDMRTTLMIKNIPNKYNCALLKERINIQFKDKYDFFYLPMDFQHKCNMGYAFINIIDRNNIMSFYNAFNGRKWELFKSKKVCEIKYARIQGKNELERHFKNSLFYGQINKVQPYIFTQFQMSGIEEIIIKQRLENKFQF